MNISFFKHKSKKEILDVFYKYGTAIRSDEILFLKIKNLDPNYYYIYCDAVREFDQNYVLIQLWDRISNECRLFSYRPDGELRIVQIYSDRNISTFRWDIYYKCHKRYFNSLSIKDIRNNLASILNTNKYKLIDIE